MLKRKKVNGTVTILCFLHGFFEQVGIAKMEIEIKK